MRVGTPNEDWIKFEGAGDRFPRGLEGNREREEAPLSITGNLLRYPTAEMRSARLPSGSLACLPMLKPPVAVGAVGVDPAPADHKISGHIFMRHREHLRIVARSDVQGREE